MDPQLPLEESGSAYDLDSAIRSLNGLRLESAEGRPNINTATSSAGSRNGSEWVEVLVTEMAAASDVDDAKARASRVLDALAESLLLAANATSSSLRKENVVLKRAVAIQHERQREYEEEVPRLKQLVAQYQEQLSKLEVSNYALAMHLKQAQQQQTDSVAGRLHPDVF